MARARNIKPAFFMNDELAEIDPLGRLLFIGLWTIADREGRLEDRPARIKVETIPYDNCDVDELLNELAKRDFIRRYEVDGVRYIQVTNFSKHQNPHRNERQSEIPAPDLHSTSTVQAPDKDGAPSGVVWKSAQVEGRQKNKSAGLAGGIQVPEKHHTSTVQEPETHNTNRADSLLLNPDSLNMNPDSSLPGSRKKPDDDDDEKFNSEIVKEFAIAFGYPPNQTQMQMLFSFLDDGLTDWHIFEALKRAAEAGASSPKYATAILQSWLAKKAFAKEDVERLDELRGPRSRPRGKIAREDFTYTESQQDRSVFAFLDDEEDLA